jgi:hypothetical protein
LSSLAENCPFLAAMSAERCPVTTLTLILGLAPAKPPAPKASSKRKTKKILFAITRSPAVQKVQEKRKRRADQDATDYREAEAEISPLYPDVARQTKEREKISAKMRRRPQNEKSRPYRHQCFAHKAHFFLFFS